MDKTNLNEKNVDFNQSIYQTMLSVLYYIDKSFSWGCAISQNENLRKCKVVHVLAIEFKCKTRNVYSHSSGIPFPGCHH